MNYFDNNPRDYSTNNNNYHNEYPNRHDGDEVVTLGTWLLILILTAIPIINIVALLFMAFSSGNINIKNYAKASLIILGISLFFVILLR